MKKTLTLLSIIALSLAVPACKKGSKTTTPPPDPGTPIKISGKVVNETGSPVSSAIVSCGTTKVTTGADGTFTLSTTATASNGNFVVQAAAPGHFSAYKNVQDIDGSGMYTVIYMLDNTTVGSMPSTGGTVTGNGFSVTAPAGAFKKTDGSAYVGDVTVSGRYIDVDNGNILNVMPGGDLLAQDPSGKVGIMRTFGFIQTQFTDSYGNLLVPDQNLVKCTITVPSYVGDPVSQGAMKWDFDTSKGCWVKPTTPTGSGGDISLRPSASGGDYPSTTTICRNLDGVAYTIGYIKGQVMCDGKPRANANVFCTNNSYNRYSTYTNENGFYKIAVESSSNYTGTYAYQIIIGADHVTVPTPPSTGGTVTAPTLTSCDSNTQIQGKTGNPRFNLQFTNSQNVDLDLHVIAPDGTEIYYANSTGDGGTLDVDCACGGCPNGPNENIYWNVGTAPHGTYKYWVVYYGDCSSPGASSTYTLRRINVNSVEETFTGTLSSGKSEVHTFEY